jgi:hypothetical protein
MMMARRVEGQEELASDRQATNFFYRILHPGQMPQRMSPSRRSWR